MSGLQWWRSGGRRTRLRRRLVVFSTPVALLLVLVIAKSVSVVVAGDTAVTAFSDRDNASLRDSVTMLDTLNVIEPAKADFAAGTLAVLDNRLPDAEREFAASLSRTDAGDSCPARVNLELVRETLGDRAFAALDGRTALARYLSAREAVDGAPDGCFAGNADADEERRAVRQNTAARLADKIRSASVAPPPPPPPPGAAGAPPPPRSGSAAADPDARLRLNPGAGDPLGKLQQILGDAAERHGS